MPQIPIYREQVNSNSVIDGRGATGDDFGAGVAREQGRLVDLVGTLADHMFKVHDEAALHKTSAQANADLDTFSTTLQQGSVDSSGNFVPPPPVAQHEQLFQDRVKAIDEQAQKNLSGGLLGNRANYVRFKESFDGQVEAAHIQVQKNSIAKAKDASLATINDAVNTYTQTAATQTGMQREQSVLAASSANDLALRSGLITAVEAVKRRDALARQMDVADVRADLRTTP